MWEMTVVKDQQQSWKCSQPIHLLSASLTSLSELISPSSIFCAHEARLRKRNGAHRRREVPRDLALGRYLWLAVDQDLVRWALIIHNLSWWIGGALVKRNVITRTDYQLVHNKIMLQTWPHSRAIFCARIHARRQADRHRTNINIKRRTQMEVGIHTCGYMDIHTDTHTH